MASSSTTDAIESTETNSPKETAVNSPDFIPTLPSDILEEFFSRLPLRSLIRSSSVWKSWYALLKNPNFVSKHFKHTTAHTYFLFRRLQSDRTTDQGTVSLVSRTESFHVPMNINLPLLNASQPLRISGSCNGLVCLTVKPEASIIILWNPITRVLKPLPVSPVDRPLMVDPNSVVLGFGFDSLSNDYKLLRIASYKQLQNQAEIYSVVSNSWREIQPHQKFKLYEDASRVIVNGRFHWAAREVDTHDLRDLIATFDISTEVFGRIKLPNIIGIHLEQVIDSDNDDDDVILYDRKLGWKLVVWKEDFLGVIIYPNKFEERPFDLWVLDVYGVEESWTKHFSFGHHITVHKPLGCKSNGEILLVKYDGQLVVYDSVNDTFEFVPVHGIPFCSEVYNYVGTLLPIEGGITVEEVNLEAIQPDPFFVRQIDMA